MEIYTNKDFEGKSFDEVCSFIEKNKDELVGSSVFTKNKSAISKLVCFTTRGRAPEGFFVPSHVGQIVEKKGVVYCFDMKPPKGTITPLADYLFSTEDEFCIVPPDDSKIKLNPKRFSLFVLKRVGQPYGTLSAICSAFRPLGRRKKKNPEEEKRLEEKERKKGEEHCSEIGMKGYQEQGLYTEYYANKTTPLDLLINMLMKVVIKDEHTIETAETKA